ncbi:ABC transporter substrate-binding protein [Pseudogracilibacillus sp. SO30301A]|uniref:ABC transporter substrate-binding protein n=1 Tax=Pseudogracilibacillus sp. SO30301A TaxID=3098291 RepID=UPI00300DF91F
MKWVRLTSLFLISILIISACGNSEKEETFSGNSDTGEKELADKLNIFNWADVIPQEVLNEFEEEFGVEVVYSTYSSEQEMMAKIKSGTVPYDVVFPSTGTFIIMKEQGLLQELDMENIPNFENLSEIWTDRPDDPGDKYSIPVAYGTNGIIYNTEKIKEKPTSWEDLWDPKYKGHVLVSDDPQELFGMALQSLGYDIGNPTEEQVKEAAKKIEDLVPNVLAFDPNPEPQFMSEQAWIGYTVCAGASVAHIQGFEKLDCVLPKEGGLKWHTSAVIPNTSKEKYTAEVFLNWYLRPEISLEMVKSFPYPSPNEEAAKLYTDEMKKLPSLSTTDEDLKKAAPTQPYSSETMELMNHLLQEIRSK